MEQLQIWVRNLETKKEIRKKISRLRQELDPLIWQQKVLMWKLLDLKFHTDEDSKQLNELPSPRASFIRLIRSVRVQKKN